MRVQILFACFIKVAHTVSQDRYIYIRHGCERWSVGGNFTMDRTGYRDIALAFGTGTRHATTAVTSQVINSTIQISSPSTTYLHIYAMMHANHEG